MSFNAAQKKRIIKRKCSALNCSNTNLSHTMHTFPTLRLALSRVKDFDDELSRCLYWIKMTGNKALLDVPPQSLNRNYFLCSSHFSEDQLTHNKTSHMKKNARPHIFDCEPISDIDMTTYCLQHSLIKKTTMGIDDSSVLSAASSSSQDKDISTTESTNSTSTKSNQPSTTDKATYCLQNYLTAKTTTVIDNSLVLSPVSSSSQNVTEKKMNTITSTNSTSTDSNGAEPAEARSPYVQNDEENTSNKPPSKSRITRKCSVKGCLRNNTTSNLFSFPNIKISSPASSLFIHIENFERCKLWLEATGNEELLQYQPFHLQKFYICSHHFKNEVFSNKLKKQLLPTAIPTELLPNPIAEHRMLWYNAEFTIPPVTDKDSFDIENNWNDIEIGLKFENNVNSLQYFTCDVCKEKQLKTKSSKLQCSHNDQCIYYSDLNNLDPGKVPDELAGLTFIEEQLIARVHPLVSVFRLKGGQFGYKGNVISFPQDIQQFANVLPHTINSLTSVLVVRFKNTSDKYHDFRVRAKKVYEALQWLINNNIYYKNVTISTDNINALPEDDDISSILNNIPSNQHDDDSITSDESDISNNAEDCSDMIFSGVPPSAPLHQDEQIEATLNWPNIDTTPVNEFTTPGYIASAFPCLYPTGAADLRDCRLKKINPANYFRHLLKYEDQRFARHKTFRFFCLNSYMRWTALTDGNIFIRNNPEFKNMTTVKLKQLLKEKPHTIKKLMFQASNIRGTSAYWRARCNELHAMTEQLNLPTIFLTLSFPDHHLNQLYWLLSGKDPSTLTDSERFKLLQDNPAIVDEFFSERVEIFINQIMKKKFKVKDYWFRIEYQHRGSPHVHALFWFEDAPDTTNLQSASEEFKKQVLNYFDKIIHAMNPDPSYNNKECHPSRLQYQHIIDHDQDLANILNNVQRHTRCSTDYCLKYNKKEKCVQCRFNFPQELTEESRFEMDSSGILQYIPKRNDPLLNKYNSYIIQFWRGNMDIAPVLSKQALIAYLVKYIVKSEISSSAMDELHQILQTYRDEDNVKSALQRLFIKVCGERDFSSQEVCHILLGLKMYSSGGREFVYIYTKKSNDWIDLAHHLQPEEEYNKKFGSSFIDKYKARPPTVENVSLWQAAVEYDTKKWNIRNSKNRIVVVYPRYGKKNKEDLTEEYCQQQMILHVPWRNEQDLKCDTQTWKDAFLAAEQINSNLCPIDLEHIQEDQDDVNDSDPENDSLLQEEWMLLSSMGPHSDIPRIELGLRDVDINHNWNASAQAYKTFGSIPEIQNFISKHKASKENLCHDFEEAYPHVRLNEQQQAILDLLNLQIKCLQQNNIKNIPKRTIVQGKAGTGKSLIIQCITSLLHKEFGKDSLLKITPTGVSALAINGQTAHSALKIPLNVKKFKPLNGETAREFCNKHEKVKFLILDEFSMVGASVFGEIELRCKQFTGNNCEDFGGLFVYMFGDVCQLPPVKDTPLYKNTQKIPIAIYGKQIFDRFDSAIVLTKSHRQNSSQFESILDRLSKGTNTIADYNALKERFTTSVPLNEQISFKDAIHLYPRVASVAEYNMKVLSSLIDPDSNTNVPIARIKSKNNSKEAAKAKTDDADGLEDVIYLCKGCKVMLRSNLWTEQGLVNGAIGRVVDILYKTTDSYPSCSPSVILCDFPSYKGPEFMKGTNIVPIPPITKTWENKKAKNCSRTQFPLQLSYACSDHKSQGLTLEQAFIDLEDNEFQLGLSYVAFSRVKTIEGLLIQPFCFDRISKLANFELMKNRVQFESYLETLREKTTKFLLHAS